MSEQLKNFDAVLQRHANHFDWLKKNHPEVFVEQKHCEEGSSERAYWHHGYMMAIRDVMRILGVMPSELRRFNDREEGRESHDHYLHGS